jgi:hypothetical protein
MVQKVGGLTRDEVDHLFQAFIGFGSVDDIAQKVDSMEGLRFPTFHAMLRQEFLSIKNSKDPQTKQWFPAFESKYNAFFDVLHIRVYTSQLAAAGIHLLTDASKHVRMNPDRLAAFVVSREDLIVAALSWLLGIMDIAELCAALDVSPQGELALGRLRPALYPEMAARMFGPSTRFADELAPFVGALGKHSYETLPSHAKSAHAVLTFLDPAAGTSLIAPLRNFDRVLEVRTERLLGACEVAIKARVSPERSRAAHVTSVGIAYSRSELQGMIIELLREGRDEKAEARRAGRVLLNEITRKVIEDGIDLAVC